MMLLTDITCGTIKYLKTVGSLCIHDHKNQNVILLLLHTEMKKVERKRMTRAFKEETSSNITHRMTSKVDVNSDTNNLQ